MKRMTFIAFLAPMAIVLIGVQIYPMLVTGRLSLMRWNLIRGTGDFIGLGNYASILQSPGFWSSALVSTTIMVLSVSIQLVIGFTIAALMYQYVSRPGILNTIFIIPVAIAPVVVGLLFKWIFNPTFGIATYLLSVIGISNPTWLSNPRWAIASIVIAEVWQYTPFVILIIYAGMQSLPEEPFESAMIDGANTLQALRYLTIPMLMPLILIAVAIRSMDAFRLFDKVYLMTGGGPGRATETLALFNYRTAFQNLRMGEGAAVAVLSLIILAAGIFWLLRIMVGRPEE